MKLPPPSAAAGADAEIHVAGILVHTQPVRLLAVCHAIDELPGAEVFQASAEGKLVVVLEAGCSRDILEMVDAIRQTDGVVNVALVYQHAETASAMGQEMNA